LRTKFDEIAMARPGSAARISPRIAECCTGLKASVPPGIAAVSTGPKAWMLMKFWPGVAAEVDSAIFCSIALVYCRWITLTIDSVPGAGSTQPTQMQRIVYFDYDSFEVKPEATQLLEANARYLNANRNVRVALEGHTDERGGREYNLALGQKRAEAVRRAMSLLGVPDSQMEAVSFGEEKPAQTGADESAWAKNRRVELTYR